MHTHTQQGGLKMIALRTKYVITALIVVGVGSLFPAMSQPVTEAPTGFDDNPIDDSSQDKIDAHRGLKEVFDEVEEITPDGLGPVYNAQSCRECHQNPVSGAASQIVELRAGRSGRNGQFSFPVVELLGGDRIEGRTLINDRAICPEAQEHVPSDSNVQTNRLSLNILGDGLVEAMSDRSILDRRDIQCHPKGTTNPRGTDPICGVAIFVEILEAQGTPNQRVGRFGWKDQHASLLSFSADAYLNEMGITNSLQPDEVTQVCNPPVQPEESPSTVREPNDQPENGVADIDRFATFMRSTKAPPRTMPENRRASIVRGEDKFKAIGCELCHAQTMFTAPAGTRLNGGTYNVPPELGSRAFHPFSDFLMHDVGTGDNVPLAPLEHFGREVALRLLRDDLQKASTQGPQKSSLEVPLSVRERKILSETVDALTGAIRTTIFPFASPVDNVEVSENIPFQFSDVCNPRSLANVDSPEKQVFYRVVFCTANKLRTPPLWGLHERSRFMHDGQSVTLQDAIDRHRGEARFVRQRYMTELSDSEKADLLAFLDSL